MKFASPSTIRKHIIGSGSHCIDGPFGKKPLVYADSTASSEAVSFIEDYIREAVLPSYANTHTEASFTGRQSSHFREQARNFIRNALNAPEAEYAVVFCGSGSTAAMDKFARVMGLTEPSAPASFDPEDRPLVLIGPYEHHSNELLWRETNAEVVTIEEDGECGAIDVQNLSNVLERYSTRHQIIGSFSAASNVTGICTDTKRITEILHDYGALACFDFSAAGPHMSINVMGDAMDAVYLSPHKFLGGPQTPGLLVARRRLFKNKVPTIPGGGTVRFVQPASHVYIDDIEQREEGGTPAIVDSIRAGLVFQLHHMVGPGNIYTMEQRFLEKALRVWNANPNLVILGHPNARRVSIVSFLVKDPMRSARYLHYNFVTALLNDLFGIQSRGGCSCAGPYGHRLLDIDASTSNGIKEAVETDGELIKPGWTRVSFSYYMDQATVDYIIEAVNLIATHGYRLLPWYSFDVASGMWTHIDACRDTVHDLWDFRESFRPATKLACSKDLSGCLRHASSVLLTPTVGLGEGPTTSSSIATSSQLPESSRKLRWFLLAEDFDEKCSYSSAASAKRNARRGIFAKFRRVFPSQRRPRSRRL